MAALGTQVARTSSGSSQTGLPSRIFNDDGKNFRELFNRASFMYAHNLAEHPLFELPQLVELAKTMWSRGDGKVTFLASDTAFCEGWNKLPRKALSVVDAVTRIHESGSWILFKSIQEVPQYRAFMTQGLQELEELTGVALHKEVLWVDAYLFLASPHSITPYHIDPESTFLMQIHGEKDYYLFDPSDRSILSDEEIERYYMGDLSAAKYKEGSESAASVYRMRPGTGVHQPVRAPHWVKNGETFSVTMSILFLLRDRTLEGRVYQANHYLRQLGMRPTPPGESVIRDQAKILALSNWGHKPKSKSEMLRYGLNRYAGSVEFAKKLAAKFTGDRTSSRQG